MTTPAAQTKPAAADTGTVADFFELLKPRVMTLVVFTGVAGVVLGGLTDCPVTRGVDAHFAAKECLLSLGVPVLAGLGAGHGRQNPPLVFGARARIEDDTFSFRGD